MATARAGHSPRLLAGTCSKHQSLDTATAQRPTRSRRSIIQARRQISTSQVGCCHIATRRPRRVPHLTVSILQTELMDTCRATSEHSHRADRTSHTRAALALVWLLLPWQRELARGSWKSCGSRSCLPPTSVRALGRARQQALRPHQASSRLPQTLNRQGRNGQPRLCTTSRRTASSRPVVTGGIPHSTSSQRVRPAAHRTDRRTGRATRCRRFLHSQHRIQAPSARIDRPASAARPADHRVPVAPLPGLRPTATGWASDRWQRRAVEAVTSSCRARRWRTSGRGSEVTEMRHATAISRRGHTKERV